MNTSQIIQLPQLGAGSSLTVFGEPLTVDYGRGFTGLLTASGCHIRLWDEKHLSGDKIPRLESKASAAFEVAILSMGPSPQRTNRITSSIESIDRSNPWGLSGIGLSLAFSAAHPDIQRARRLVALGFVISVDGDQRTLILGGDQCERYLTLGYIEGVWDKSFSFLLCRPRAAS